jgi:hypothetical protein
LDRKSILQYFLTQVKRATLAGKKAMLKTAGERVVEASTATAVAKAAREETKKLVAQARPLKLVCSQPESDWSQSKEASGGARERQKEMLDANLEVDLE